MFVCIRWAWQAQGSRCLFWCQGGADMLGISNGSCPPAIGASQWCLPGRAPLTDLFISAFIHACCFNSLSVGTICPVRSTQEPQRVIGGRMRIGFGWWRDGGGVQVRRKKGGMFSEECVAGKAQMSAIGTRFRLAHTERESGLISVRHHVALLNTAQRLLV